MRIDLLLVLLFETEQHLDWCVSALDLDDSFLDLERHLGGVFVNVCRNILAINLLLRNTILIDAHSSQNSSCSRVDLSTTIADHADHNLLPRFLSPRLTVRPSVHELNILDYAHHCTRKQFIFFIV